VDWSLRVLLHELRRLGLDERTLVIFTSDNGGRGDHGGSNAPLRGRKGTTWEGGQRVPCLMRWPGFLPQGMTCTAVATAMDFLPTLAGLAGAALPSDRIIDGKDLSVLWKDPSAADPHQSFFYYRRNSLEAVRAGPWKLHVARGGETVCELYNLVEDIGETRDRATDHRRQVAEMQQRVAQCREDLGDETAGVHGRHCRPLGRVADPQPLTKYDPSHPYITALYDLPDRG
jgi:arylsulfatase A-like enzyme